MLKLNYKMDKKAPKLILNPVFLFVIISMFAVIGVAFFATSLTNNKSVDELANSQVMSSEVKIENGVQYISVDAKNGFNPKYLTLKSEIPSVLTVKTKNTYDCSSTLVIPDLKISKQLPITGNTAINIPAQKAGTKMTATCGMGHYPLYLNFIDA